VSFGGEKTCGDGSDARGGAHIHYPLNEQTALLQQLKLFNVIAIPEKCEKLQHKQHTAHTRTLLGIVNLLFQSAIISIVPRN